MTDRIVLFFAAALVLAPPSHARQVAPITAWLQATPARPPPDAPQAAPSDPALVAAEDLIGKALILRGFPASNSLAYDYLGKLQSTPQPADWTLAAVNILKATHPAPDHLELEGVRVAIRYNADAHEFQRHPLNDQKIKLLIPLAPGAIPTSQVNQLRAAFAAIFSIGIDPALQRSMTPLWSHYFDPSLPFPPDAVTPSQIYNLFGLPDEPKDVTPPTLTHKIEAEFTDPARHDNVKGTIQFRIIIDPQGIPQRIVVVRPLGYGLEERSAETIAKWRFTPAMRAGKAVASAIVINIDFEISPPQR